VVRAEVSRQRGRGFESHRILDGCKRFASYYIKEKNENKGSQPNGAQQKKKIKSIHKNVYCRVSNN